MRGFSRKISLGGAIGLCAVLLGGCGNGTTESENIVAITSTGAEVVLTDGPMADINECIERNNTEYLDIDAGRTACAWAYSVPFAGMPPGVTGHLVYEWPRATVTIVNNNAMILLTQICIQVQFDSRHMVQNVCGGIIVSPMEQTTTSINMRGELTAIGVDADYEVNLETLQWGILSARYIQLLVPLEEE